MKLIGYSQANLKIKKKKDYLQDQEKYADDNFLNAIKFLKMADSYDRLLAGLPPTVSSHEKEDIEE